MVKQLLSAGMQAHPDVERLFSGAMANADNLGVASFLWSAAGQVFSTKPHCAAQVQLPTMSLMCAGVEAMLTDFAWQRFNRFVDIGGSSGSFLAALLERHPNSSGIIFDLPQVDLDTEAKANCCELCKWSSMEESAEDGRA